MNDDSFMGLVNCFCCLWLNHFQIFTISLAWEVGHPQSNLKKYFWGKTWSFGDADEEASPFGQLGQARKFLVSDRTSRCIHRLKLLAFITALLFNPWPDWQHGRCQGLDGLIDVLVKAMDRNRVINLDCRTGFEQKVTKLTKGMGVKPQTGKTRMHMSKALAGGIGAGTCDGVTNKLKATLVGKTFADRR